jgi:hypothetical protein
LPTPLGTDFRLTDPENFRALLDRSLHCSFCKRPLRDNLSTLLGYGPDCARQAHLPHDLEAANRILLKRAELLEQGAEGPG